MEMIVKRAKGGVDISAGWEAPCWKDLPVAELLNVRPESSEHHPQVSVKLQYDEKKLYVLFMVKDKYVLATQKNYNDMVCQDSCVEFFFQPEGNGAYFNLECNCGGTILMSCIRDAMRVPGGFADFTVLPSEALDQVEIYHSLPKNVEPEDVKEQTWFIGEAIPFDMLKKFRAFRIPKAGDVWRCNFYKCGDNTSHPHWISWAPVKKLNFHRPEDFENLVFE